MTKITPHLLLVFFLLTGLKTTAQEVNCGCSVTQVQTNSVQSCDTIVGTVDTVRTVSEFWAAISKANKSGNRTILIANGTYSMASTSKYPYITGSNIVFRSLSGNRDSVIITGQGMKDVAPKVEIGIYVVGDHITIADLTIKNVGNHAIATTGEHMLVHNVRIQNTFEQMIKGTSGADGSDSSIVQCSLFEYTAGIGPQFYIGGLDIHDGDYWNVRDNVFYDIESPSKAVAEHAVHFWNSSSHNIVERNVIVNCDRGIGFGLGSSRNDGGIIRNNMIYNDGKGKYADVGIGLETSPGTKVYNNTIHIEYQNAIEYRFAATKDVMISNNLSNKQIKLREGAQASLAANYTTAQSSWFVNPSKGNLRLNAAQTQVVGKGLVLAEVKDDIDQKMRGASNDLGAHQYGSVSIIPSGNDELVLYPNPATTRIFMNGSFESIDRYRVYDLQGQTVLEGENLQRNAPINVDGLRPGLYYLQIPGKVFSFIALGSE